jgi:putative transcriptional regulator
MCEAALSLGSSEVMTRSNSHPSPERLLNYALGELPAGPALTLRSHIDDCATCRAIVEAREEIEGRLMVDSPEATLRTDALAAVLSRIGEPTPASADGGKDFEDIKLPAALAEISFAPRRRLGPDIWVAHIATPCPEGWLTYLLKAPASSKFPNHGHLGPEFISLLDGAYSDTSEHLAGDFMENGPGFEHVMEVSKAGPCLCLISTYGPIPWMPADISVGRTLGV